MEYMKWVKNVSLVKQKIFEKSFGLFTIYITKVD